MKLFCLFALLLCVHANAAGSFRNEFIGGLAKKIGLDEFPRKSSALESYPEPQNEDEKAATRLAALEKVAGRNLVADLIEQLLNSFRDVIINGNDVLPPLDPLNIPVIGPYVYTTTGVRAQAQVNNFHMVGLRWYAVDYVTFNTLRLQVALKLSIPYITAGGRCEARASIILVSHTAGFDFRVLVNRPEVSVSARLGTNLQGGHLTLRELDINISMSTIDIQLDGMTGSSLINNVVSALVQNLVNSQLHDELEGISRLLSEQLFEIINEILKDYTLADILG